MTQEEKIYGIETLKKLFKGVYETTDEVVKDLKDGNISLTEILGLTDNLFNVISILSKIPELKQEIEDVTTDEIKELYEYIISFGFVPEDVTEILRHLVELSQIEIDAYNDHIKPIIDIIKKMREQKAVN